jgi:hypothetical protein
MPRNPPITPNTATVTVSAVKIFSEREPTGIVAARVPET